MEENIVSIPYRYGKLLIDTMIKKNTFSISVSIPYRYGKLENKLNKAAKEYGLSQFLIGTVNVRKYMSKKKADKLCLNSL